MDIVDKKTTKNSILSDRNALLKLSELSHTHTHTPVNDNKKNILFIDYLFDKHIGQQNRAISYRIAYNVDIKVIAIDHFESEPPTSPFLTAHIGHEKVITVWNKVT